MSQDVLWKAASGVPQAEGLGEFSISAGMLPRGKYHVLITSDVHSVA